MIQLMTFYVKLKVSSIICANSTDDAFFRETTTIAKTGGGTVAFKMKFTIRKAADRWSFMKQLLTTWQEGYVIFSIAFSIQKHFVATTPHLDLCNVKAFYATMMTKKANLNKVQ